jgi:predicted TIM-barrel fold metal-dependent hydrolase
LNVETGTRIYQVISGDGHLESPPEDWTPWIPKRLQPFAPRTVTDPERGVECIAMEGAPLTPIGPGATCGDDPKYLKRTGNSYYEADRTTRRAGLGDAVQRLHEQDMDGIDAELLYPSGVVAALRRQADDVIYRAMIQAYNTWLAESYCAVAPDRLIGLGAIPETNVDDAIAEMRRCKALGLKGVTISKWPNGGARYKPEDDAFFAALLEEGMRLAPHISFGAAIPSVAAATQAHSGGAGLAPTLVEDPGNPERRFYAFKTPNKTAGNIVELALNGVLDRFPDLKVYFAESKAGWIADWLENCSDVYATTRHWYGVKLARPLEDYVRRQVMFCFIRGYQDVHLCHIWGGEKNLAWGSDLPHNAATFPFSREWIDRAFDGEPQSLRRQILVENIAEFFGLDTTRSLTPTPPGGPYVHPKLADTVPFVKENGRYVTVGI